MAPWAPKPTRRARRVRRLGAPASSGRFHGACLRPLVDRVDPGTARCRTREPVGAFWPAVAAALSPPGQAARSGGCVLVARPRPLYVYALLVLLTRCNAELALGENGSLWWRPGPAYLSSSRSVVGGWAEPGWRGSIDRPGSASPVERPSSWAVGRLAPAAVRHGVSRPDALRLLSMGSQPHRERPALRAPGRELRPGARPPRPRRSTASRSPVICGFAATAVLVALTRGDSVSTSAGALGHLGVRTAPSTGWGCWRPRTFGESSERRCPPADDMCPASFGRSVGSPR